MDHWDPEAARGRPADQGAVPAVRLERGDVQARKSKYKGMHVEEAKRLKTLEDENRRLKHVVAELSLEKRALEAALGKTW